MIPPDEGGTWRDTLGGVPHTIAHTAPFVRAIQVTTHHPTFLVKMHCGKSIGICPVAERTFRGRVDLVTPYGPGGFAVNWPAEDGVPASGELWRRLGETKDYVCGYIALHPLLGPHLSSGDESHESCLHVLDLTQSELSLYERLDRNRKRQLRAWGRGGEVILMNDAGVARFFVEHYGRFMASKAAAPVYGFVRETLEALVRLPGTLLVGATRHGNLEAATLYGYTSHGADALFTVSLSPRVQHSTAMTWHAMLELRERGVPWLNLGGGVRGDDSIASFKRRFGGREVPFRALKQVYDEDAYASLCAAVGADPRDRSGYFPPWWRP